MQYQPPFHHSSMRLLQQVLKTLRCHWLAWYTEIQATRATISIAACITIVASELQFKPTDILHGKCSF
jgi:hypothetical protein